MALEGRGIDTGHPCKAQHWPRAKQDNRTGEKEGPRRLKRASVEEKLGFVITTVIVRKENALGEE